MGKIVIRHSLDLDIPGRDKIFVAGEWRTPATDARWEMIDPSTEQSLGSVALAKEADADAAVAAARTAFDRGPWPRMPIEQRVEVVRRWTDSMEAAASDFAKGWALETGFPIAVGNGMTGSVAAMTWGTPLALASGLPWEEDRGDALVRREPVGVVLAILTYNGPVTLFGMKVVPALLAGCPVIVKAAPESQIISHIAAECARGAGFPAGVISFLPTDTPTTQYLVGHPGVDMVAVTGSQAIARDILVRTAPRLARTAMELGGKSPAIVAEDADLSQVVPNVAEGAQSMNGQVCVALSRIYVPATRHDEFTNAIVDYLTSKKIGDPLDPEVWAGPLAVERAIQRTDSYVKGAISEGANLVTGGRRPTQFDRGFFYEPTVLTNVNNAMTVAREEVFGPVTAIISYNSLDEAIDMANDTVYGLSAAVYTQDADLAIDIARRLRSGTVGVGSAGMSLSQPFGGIKQSGWGRECGPEGILEFTDIKQMLVAGGASFLAG